MHVSLSVRSCLYTGILQKMKELKHELNEVPERRRSFEKLHVLRSEIVESMNYFIITFEEAEKMIMIMEKRLDEVDKLFQKLAGTPV